MKWLPIPMAAYERDGKVVLANSAMLDRLGIKDEHIENRRINIYDVTDVEFRNAAKLALRGAVMFLPFEYINGDKKIQTGASDLRYGE